MYQSDITYYYCIIPKEVHQIEGYGDLKVKSYTYDDIVVFLDVIEYDTEIFSSVVTKSAAEAVEKLRLAAQENVNHLQYELAPFLANKFVRFEEKDNDYVQNGQYARIPVMRDYRVFKVNGLRFFPKFTNKKKYSRKDWLLNMVNDKVVYPFLLFINGSVVKWSRIELLRDYEYTYIMVHGLDMNEEIDFSIIEFPCNVRYGEDDDILPEDERSIGIYFDKYGYITLGDDIRCRLEIIDDSIYADYQKITAEKPYISFEGLDKHQTKPASVITFRDGVISPEETENLVYEGWNVYANLNPDDYGSRRYLTFYSTKTLPSANHEHTPCIDIDYNRTYMKNYYGGGAQYIRQLLKLSEFNFTYDRDLSFSENVNNALNYIMSYDANLINEAYRKDTDVFVDHYTGKECKERAGKDNIMTVSRKRCGKFDANLMVFRNGECLPSTDLRYHNNLIDISTNKFDDKDRFEFVFTTPSYAEPVQIVVPDADTPVYVRSDIDVSRSKLYISEKHNLTYNVFDIDPDGRTQFEVNFDVARVEGNYYTFYLGEDDFYYGKTLTLVPDNQMKHCVIKLESANKDTDGDYYFLLPTDFNFCHNKNHYMLFLNGKLLSKQNFTVTEPKTTRPFDKLYLYITTHLEPSDVLEVYYMPCELTDEIYLDKLELTGDVIVDASNISVPLSTDNYFIFVDGKKINPEDVINISRNKLRIKTTYGSIHNVVFTRYNHSIEEIEEAFKYTGDDEWSRYIDSLHQFELNRLINNTTILKDNGEDYMIDHYPLSAIVSDVVADYYVKRAGLDKTNRIFVYDFEKEAAGIDTGCDSIGLTLTDASRADKMHYYWNNARDEELEGIEIYESPVDS